jgi:hypothetical protein
MKRLIFGLILVFFISYFPGINLASASIISMIEIKNSGHQLNPHGIPKPKGHQKLKHPPKHKNVHKRLPGGNPRR